MYSDRNMIGKNLKIYIAPKSFRTFRLGVVVAFVVSKRSIHDKTEVRTLGTESIFFLSVGSPHLLATQRG